MSRFEGRWIAEALGTAADGLPGVEHFSIDTRTLRPGSAFVAIRGERFDGHEFVERAVEQGAALIVAERDVASSVPVARVPSTRSALKTLANAHRSRLRGAVVGVTGSNGKTTAVRMIDSVLAAGGRRGSASIKSFNNELGVPLTLLGAGVDDDYLVSEMGTSGPGEIGRLADIGRPEIAVITSIGRAHLEKLGSVAGIAREKAQIARHARLVVVHGDAPFLLDELPSGVPRLTFGRGRSCGAPVEIEDAGGERVVFRVDGERFEIAMGGTHNALNAAAAVLVARELRVDDDAIRRGLLAARPPEMRWQRRTLDLTGGAVELINDAYNANPDSAIASLEALGAADRRRVLVLGEMLELGDQSDALHAEVGRAIAQAAAAGGGPELLVVVGDAARAVERGLHAPAGPEGSRDARGGASVGARGGAGGGASGAASGGGGVRAVWLGSGWSPRAVAGLIEPGDRVVLKGSRGVGLERVAAALAESSAGPAGLGAESR
ncbi:MAG: UDP-N-acetylmuramoyl-tripeptide--D-alanyl-D-alanine ligase [Planctomycetota bacterium]